MIYTLENTSKAGNPILVFDANGLEWYRTLECDTETGRIVYQKVDDQNRLLIDPETKDAITVEEFAAAPLTIVPSDGRDPTGRHSPSQWVYEGCICGETTRSDCPVYPWHKKDNQGFTEYLAFKKYNLPTFKRMQGEQDERLSRM